MFNSTGFFFPTVVLLSNSFVDVQPPTTPEAVGTTEAPPHEPQNEMCHGMFECFPIGPPWTSARRPIALYPEKQSKIDVRFAVFSGRNRTFPAFLDLDQLDSVHRANINPSAMIYVITHGFLESGKARWIEKLLNLLLDRDRDATVMVVDWGKGSNPPYNQACANIRLVGVIAAHVIHMIYEELPLPNLDRVHMIGHSLGAHLSGYTGQALREKYRLRLGRITGLDPAELAFTETDELVRLDPSDAQFVDTIHSDATPFVPKIGLGLYEPIGHLDFYPNGGYNQPGCRREFWKRPNTRFVSDMFQFFSCSHSRAYMYFIESITTPLVTVSCDSYESYLAGRCFDCRRDGALCVGFGLNSAADYRRLVALGRLNPTPYAPIQLFFRTGGQEPFLLPNLKIVAKVSDAPASVAHGPEIGRLVLYLHAAAGGSKSDKIYFNEQSMLFEPGYNYSTIIAGYSIDRLSAITVGWEYDTNLLNPLTWRLLSAPRVFLESVTVQALVPPGVTLRMCPASQSPITTNAHSLVSQPNCKRAHPAT
ncbi:pancreatic triacylglycerol lipase-like [Anopheles cruzii]|uniref:pancreatic triacylglycerol lipase-like n=1 Tax=Anopheles cruzii TaxID=68878 RepID=UPI0022EC520F|nr:pancreatic triacylglycerol lipase-like [Anopheles cruzii]